MTQKQNIKITLILGLFSISLGGFLLHYRVHPPLLAKWTNDIPFFIGLFNIIVIPWLFLFNRWISLAYLLNGLSVIFGTIFMAHFSIVHLSSDISIKTIFLNTTLADIIILFVKFTLGKALFDLHFANMEKELTLRYKFIRYPNMGWWLIHFVLISIVYTIGVILL